MSNENGFEKFRQLFLEQNKELDIYRLIVADNEELRELFLNDLKQLDPKKSTMTVQQEAINKIIDFYEGDK